MLTIKNFKQFAKLACTILFLHAVYSAVEDKEIQVDVKTMGVKRYYILFDKSSLTYKKLLEKIRQEANYSAETPLRFLSGGALIKSDDTLNAQLLKMKKGDTLRITVMERRQSPNNNSSDPDSQLSKGNENGDDEKDKDKDNEISIKIMPIDNSMESKVLKVSKDIKYDELMKQTKKEFGIDISENYYLMHAGNNLGKDSKKIGSQEAFKKINLTEKELAFHLIKGQVSIENENNDDKENKDDSNIEKDNENKDNKGNDNDDDKGNGKEINDNDHQPRLTNKQLFGIIMIVVIGVLGAVGFIYCQVIQKGGEKAEE